MIDRNKQKYQTPQVTSVAFVVEKGFQSYGQEQNPETFNNTNGQPLSDYNQGGDATSYF